MTTTFRDLMNELPPERRARVEARTAEMLRAIDERAAVRAVAKLAKAFQRLGLRRVTAEAADGRTIDLSKPTDALELRARRKETV